ncbi:MAG: hypothetical protein IT279_03025 [Ignavibacteriaceae bacterium]|nr:hypothetical protein [Ignavibacteriaceae bacterium]
MNANYTIDDLYNDIKNLPPEIIPQAGVILRTLISTYDAANREANQVSLRETLSGIWKDERSADEIIDEIHEARSGYGRRDVEL